MAKQKHWYDTPSLTESLTSTSEGLGELYSYRRALADMVTDGDTINGTRLAGIDSMESVGFDANNEKAQKILDEYGISFADQAKYGKQATEILRQKIMEGDYQFQNLGKDTLGRKLVSSQQLNEELLATGLYAPTDRYDKKSQDLFRKAQEKTARINSKQAEMMEAQRQYNISGQAPGILDRLGAPVDALQSGAQQLVVGTGDFLLDVLTPGGNNTWLDEAKSAEAADKEWGYDRKEAQFQQDELMNDWEQGNYGSALGTAALLAPEVIGESLPMMASMMTPTGLGRAAVAGLGAKALGATAKAAKAEGAIREANALSKFATSMTDDGFMLAVGTTTNNHIDEFTANNGGVGPSYGEIARMTAINALQLGTDKFAFQDIIGAGNVSGLVKAMKPMTKVVPEGVLGSIATGVARTAMAMGEEAGQEYFQTWAEILNGQLGTTKYGSMEQIFANEQNQDEATLGALLGAGAGGGMHIGAMPVNAIKDKMNKGREEIERADANRQEMTRQLLSGELDLDTNPISFSGEGKAAAQNDVVLLASHSDNKVGTELAIAAMRPEVDTDDAIGKVDASLRRAFNVGENIAGIEAGLDPAVNEVRYQDTSFKIALKTLDKLSMIGTDTKANIDTSVQIAEVMDAYAKILPPERLAQLHLNLLDRTIKTLQSAAMTDTANEGSTIAKSIGAAGESYKVSTEFMTKALKQLRASEDALGVSVVKGSYGGTSGGGFGSPKDALDAISMFAAGLAAKIQEAEKTGYAEFKGSPYDALKGTSQVASEILIKGKTGTNGIYGKGLIQHAMDISDDIAKAANSKKKTINTANLKSFVDFAMQRFKKSTYKFTDSRDGKDFKSTFFPRTTIFGTEEETGLAQKRYLTNYHDQMDPSGNTAAQKKIEAQYMLDMIQRMIMLLEASKGQIEEKSYNDMMADLRAIEAQQIADIKAADEVIAKKAANKDPDPMVAVSINKYLRKGAYIPSAMRDLVQAFKDNMSEENIGENQFYYVYVPLSYINGGKKTGVSPAEEYYANSEMDLGESDDAIMYDENGDELGISSGSESETKAKKSDTSSVDRYTKFPDSDPFPALNDGWLKDTLVQNLKIAFNRKILEKVEDLAAHDMTMKEIVAELVKQGFNTNEDEVSAVRSYLDIPSMNVNGVVNSDYAIWKEQYFADKKSETKAKVDENVDNKPEDGKSEPQDEGTADAVNETTNQTNEPGGEGKTSDETPKGNEGSEGTQEGNEEPKQGIKKSVKRKASPSGEYKGLTHDQAVTVENYKYSSSDEKTLEIARLVKQNRLEKAKREALTDILEQEFQEWISDKEIAADEDPVEMFFNEKFAEADEAISQANKDLYEDMSVIASENGIDYKGDPEASISENLKAFRSAASAKIKELKSSAKAALTDKASGSVERIGKLGQILNALVKDIYTTVDETMLEGKAVVLKAGKDGTDLKIPEIKKAAWINKAKSEATLKANENASEITKAQSRIKRIEAKIKEINSEIDGANSNDQDKLKKQRANLHFAMQKDVRFLQVKSILREASNIEEDAVTSAETESSSEETSSEPKSSKQVKKTDKPAKFNMFTSLGDTKHDVKADIEQIDATIASLKEEEKSLRAKRVAEIVELKMADSSSMIFSGKGLNIEENAARKERDKRFRREAHLQVNKEFRGCF